MSSDSKRTISFSVASQDDKKYLDAIADEKGYGKASTMARVALVQMLTRMKVPFPPDEAITECENHATGQRGV